MPKKHGKDQTGRLFQNHNFVPRPLEAGFFSRFFLTYLQDVIRSGGKRELTQDDVFALPEEEEAGYRHRLFADEWSKQMELPADQRSLFTVFKNLQRGPLIIAGLLYALGTTLAAGQPLLVKFFIVWLTAVHDANNPSNGSSTASASSQSIEYPGLNVPVSNDLWIGILILLLIPFVAFLIPIFQQNAVIRSLKVGMSLRSGMILAVYEKTLNLSSRAHQSEGAGNILTLMSNDAQKIMESFLWMMFGVFAPYQLIMITITLCIILGPYGLLPLGFTFVMFPPSMIVSKRYMAIRMQMVGETVARTGLITEFFSAIRAIKYYAWEKPMLQKIDEHRESELRGLGNYLMNQAYLFALLYLSPVVATVGTLVIYRAGVGNLPLDVAFAAVAGISLMRMPMVFLPIFFGIIAQNKVAMTRIANFLSLEELRDSPIQAALKKKNSKHSIVVKGATFSWSGVPLLNDLSFKLPKSSLTMVIGQVGSGKSTLISDSGKRQLFGTVAYVPQQAFILNASVKDNITFGLPFVERKYQRALKDAQLLLDLELLPAGDLTEVGERGITLSGGQKQRLRFRPLPNASIARALYSDADIYLFDDPLSALDAHVGKKLFEVAILKHLKDKCVVLATNQLQYLPQANQILVLNEQTITEQGAFHDLLAEKGEFHKLMKAQGIQASSPDLLKETSAGPNLVLSTSNAVEEKTPKPKAAPTSTAEEESQHGKVGKEIYWSWVKGGTRHRFWPFVLILALGSLCQLGQGLWLGVWSTADDAEAEFGFYGGIYALWGLASVVAQFVALWIYRYFVVRANESLHRKVLHRVAFSPTVFFDVTPLGRILNRFSKDTDNMDMLLPSVFQGLLSFWFLVAVIIISTAISSPWLLLILPFVAVGFYFFQRWYRKTAIALQRMESISRSPIFSHFQQTLTGLSTIRAFNLTGQFSTDNEYRLNRNNELYYMLQCGNTWLSMRLEWIAAGVVGINALSCFLAIYFNLGFFTIALASFAISTVSSLGFAFAQVSRNATDLEIRMNSIERLLEYTKLPQEGKRRVKGAKLKSWPSQGTIEFKKAVMRYRPDMPIILNKLNVKFEGGQKVGVVGRTGAGKSSILVTLFRFVELESGSIKIDGVDIASIGLEDLRSKLSIIPQEPTLFAGTLRSNLDPFNQFSDKELWAALERVQLKSVVKEMKTAPPKPKGRGPKGAGPKAGGPPKKAKKNTKPEPPPEPPAEPKKLGLLSPVTDNGENFSVGQRQLICLARALLRNSQILLLDEATASVDVETDEIIQKTIRSAFASATIITIAHRLNTIMDYDRILVMNGGKVAEYDSPLALIEKGGIFASLLDEYGSAADNLKKIARGEIGVAESLASSRAHSVRRRKSEKK